MQPVENAVIAVAGLGSRLGLGHPKCMLEFNGVTLLSRMINLLEKHVSRIHIVVGYREDLVIEHCAHYHPYTVLVRNPDFRTTNTAQSLAIGAQHLKGKSVFLDGDLIVTPDSFNTFLEHSARVEILLGLCEPNTEHAVYAHADTLDEDFAVKSFTRDQKTRHEWANIFSGPSHLMQDADNFVFEHLAKSLPLPGHMLELVEVDTSLDMASAQLFVNKHGL